MLPQSACMSAFQAAWVSDHGGEGGGRGEGEQVKARGRGGSKAMAVVAVGEQGGRDGRGVHCGGRAVTPCGSRRE